MGLFQSMGSAKALRLVSVVALLDSVIGLFFHVRGISASRGVAPAGRKHRDGTPGICAPPLRMTAYLGLIASFCVVKRSSWRQLRSSGWSADIREGRFQEHLAVVTLLIRFLAALRPSIHITKTISVQGAMDASYHCPAIDGSGRAFHSKAQSSSHLVTRNVGSGNC